MWTLLMSSRMVDTAGYLRDAGSAASVGGSFQRSLLHSSNRSPPPTTTTILLPFGCSPESRDMIRQRRRGPCLGAAVEEALQLRQPRATAAAAPPARAGVALIVRRAPDPRRRASGPPASRSPRPRPASRGSGPAREPGLRVERVVEGAAEGDHLGSEGGGLQLVTEPRWRVEEPLHPARCPRTYPTFPTTQP